MADSNEPTESSSTSSIAVSLTIEQWQSVLAGLEVGIKAIGFTAFVPGGELMQAIKEQVESHQVSKQSNELNPQL